MGLSTTNQYLHLRCLPLSYPSCQHTNTHRADVLVTTVCVFCCTPPPCRSVALDVVKDMTKQRFRAYVQQAQKERDRRSAAQVLKKLVQVRVRGLDWTGL